MVFAIDDDHVLGTANDVDIAIRQIPHIASVEPSIDQARIGRFLVAEIFLHQGRASAPHFANCSVRNRRAVFVADLDGHVFYGTPTIDDCAIPDRAVRRARVARKFGLFNQLNLNAFTRRHD